MNKNQKNHHKQKPLQPHVAPTQSGLRKWMMFAVIALAGLLIGMGVRRATQQQLPAVANEPATAATTDEVEPASEPVALATTVKTVFDAVLGKWVRSEGGYVLDLRAVDRKVEHRTLFLVALPVTCSTCGQSIARGSSTRSTLIHGRSTLREPRPHGRVRR